MNLYQEKLMDHYRFSCNKGRLAAPDFTSEEHNPSCGDSVSFQGKIVDGRLNEVVFEGKGCVISQATASMLSQDCKGKAVADIVALDASYIKSLIGIELGLTRFKCALLPLQALQQGIVSYLKNSQ